jgi:hypothetical protein
VELEAELNHLKEENDRLRAEQVVTRMAIMSFSYPLCMALIGHVSSFSFSFFFQKTILLSKKKKVTSPQ